MSLDFAALAEELEPAPLQETWNGRQPSEAVGMRAADLPGMVAVPVRELVPDMPEPIWSPSPALGPTDLEAVRERTRRTVRAMDWSKIQPKKRVNLLANPHGLFLCGEAYVVMLEEIAEHIKKTCNVSVKVCLAESMGHIENHNWRKLFDLDNRFDKFEEVPQCGPGQEVKTKLGHAWVMQRLFNGDYFIHTHVTEMREAYLHRMIDRLYKPFGMSYVRLETRSAYHFGFGPRTGQLIARTVFESDFIQQRYVGTVALDAIPEGVVDVVGHNDLRTLDRQISSRVLRNYGTLIRLMAEIKECIVLYDGHYPGLYSYAGGITFSNLENATVDFFDLDNLAALGSLNQNLPESGLMIAHNHAIRGFVVNFMAGGLPMTSQFKDVPVFFSNPDVYNWVLNDPCNAFVDKLSELSRDLPTAVANAVAATGTDHIMVFDNTPGAFRVSEPLAKHLRERAPHVHADVINNRLPKWLAQRNLV